MPSSIVDIGVARIKATVTEETSDINRLVKTFLSNNNNRKKIIGLDTERAQKGRRQNRTALLQLCDGDHCLVVQLPSDEDEEDDELPLSLFNFLNLPDITFVGIGINKSLMKLESEFGLTCKNAVEVGPATCNLTNKSADLKFLMCNVVPTKKPTSPVMDDWDTFALNKNQIKLAVSNVYLAYGMGNILMDGFGI